MENNQGAVFESKLSYWEFSKEVARSWRYVRSLGAQRFLDTLAASSHGHAINIAKGRLFYRAQVAQHDKLDEDIGETMPAPALPDRMRPLLDRATEGRVNPKGIPCLYVAADEHTAIAEARPWIGSLVSVGVFITNRDLKIVDCTRASESLTILTEGDASAQEKSEAYGGN